MSLLRRSSRTRSLAFLIAATLPLSSARAETPERTADAAFLHKPKTSTDAVGLQLEDAELGDFAKVISELTGKRFVFATPKLAKLKATVIAPEKVTVAVAYQAFLSVLARNGLTVIPRAGFYEIVESQDVARQLTPLERGELPSEERYVTRVHRLAHLPAEDVATTVLAKLQTKDASVIPYGNVLIITETAANLRRMLEILEAIDHAGEEDKLWLRGVRHLPSAQIEKQLTEMLGLNAKGDAAAKDPIDRPGGPLRVSRIVALERPNAIVVVGTKASFDRIAELLEVLDVAPSNELQIQVVMLQHSDAKKIVAPLNEALGNAVTAANASQPAATSGKAGGATAPASALESAVKIAADETTNALIVTATPRDFVHVREVIRALDRPKRQVLIEAAILDISVDHGLDLGVAWHGGQAHDAMIGPPGSQQTTYGGWRAGSSAGPPSATDLQGFALGVRGPDIPFLTGIPGVTQIPSFGALLSAIATSKGADILSTPTILASDNTQAEIKVQLQTSLQPNAPSIASFFPGSTGIPGAGIPGMPGALPGSTGVAASYKGIGPHIKVTPHLNESDEVRLDIVEVISDIQSAPDQKNTFGTISYVERTASTTLTVKDGRTIVIGGLTRNHVSRSESKVPVLGDIPVLGALFRTRSEHTAKSNLVLVLTPHIIRDEDDMRRVLERKREERQELIDRDVVFRGKEWTPPRDWQRTRGVLAVIREDHRRVAVAKREAGQAVANGESLPATPLDLPVPQVVAAPKASSAPAATTPAASGGRPVSRATVVEK